MTYDIESIDMDGLLEGKYGCFAALIVFLSLSILKDKGSLSGGVFHGEKSPSV